MRQKEIDNGRKERVIENHEKDGKMLNVRGRKRDRECNRK